MVVTSAAQTTPTSSDSTTPVSTPTLNYNDFLQLLIAQMQNQDPTSPTDSTQWVSQLATFSGVEQAVQTNATLSQILQESALSGASALIGQTATSADGKTSGVIASITTSTSGVTAKLQDGTSLPLSAGVTVGQ
ncbi:MAG: flagellar hook assembly protein FlgD [Hyphomicrobiales bacterium]|nr:flagellar hook assembly protein FlgD [Hyphomicrobiales bacterium]